MARWQPDGAERLHAAALELFAEQGFERTTVAEIAARAGLTQRTFFNHFADKREVVFGLAVPLQEAIVREIAACPDEVPPLDAVVHALIATADEVFEGRRAAVSRRLDIIAANPGLQERELSKQAALTDAVAATLGARGLGVEAAVLTAHAGMLVHHTAVSAWVRSGESRPLSELLAAALVALRAAVDGRPGRRVPGARR